MSSSSEDADHREQARWLSALADQAPGVLPSPPQNVVGFYLLPLGWRRIIESLVMALSEARASGIAPDIEILQLKEKLGRLSLSMHGAGELERCVANETVERSEVTCAECGALAPRSQPPSLPMCEKHRG
ncbi:TPA: hypothetical protein UL921_001204 [Stenotrophomonas maltophilia]|nr:hypothetical protein [Stenotrophomonas maltophilia]